MRAKKFKKDDYVMIHVFANLHTEAAVVGVVCIIFLILMVVAGVREIIKNKDS